MNAQLRFVDAPNLRADLIALPAFRADAFAAEPLEAVLEAKDAYTCWLAVTDVMQRRAEFLLAWKLGEYGQTLDSASPEDQDHAYASLIRLFAP